MAENNITAGTNIQNQGPVSQAGELADICVVEEIGNDGVMTSTISRPEAGQILDVTMFPGQKYLFDFAEGEVKEFSQDNGDLILSFADGSVIVLHGFDAASNADIPALVAFSDVIGDDVTDADGVTPNEDVLDDVQSEIREQAPVQEQQDQLAQAEAQEVAKVEPASGEMSAQQAAQIAPAAGDTGATGPQNSGYGINSSPTAAPFSAPDAIGPLQRTALAYGIEYNEDKVLIEEAQSSSPATIDPPTLTVNGGVDEVQVKEDGSVDVNVVAALDSDAPSTDYLTVTVTGIDSSWGFSSTVGTYDASTGTWTYVVPAGEDLSTVLTFTPPADSDVDLTNLVATVTSTSTDGSVVSGEDDEFYITVDAVADDPTIVGDDDVGVANDVLDVDFQGHLGSDDSDGSESITGYKISGLDSGFTLTVNGVTVTPVNGVYSIDPADIGNVQVIPPTDYAGRQTLSVTVLTEDTPSDGEYDTGDNTNSATTEVELTWYDDPTITVKDSVGSEVDNAQVYEDNSIDLTVNAGFGAFHEDTAVLTVTVTGIDSSWGFSSTVGTYDAATGTWTYTAPANTEITEVLTFTPPAQSDIDMSGLVATVTLNDAANGMTLTDSDGFNIIVDAVADDITINTQDDAGRQGQDLDVDFKGHLGADNDGSESITHYTISGLPNGFALNGTYTYDATTDTYTVLASDIDNLTVTPPSSYKGSITLDVTAYSEEAVVHDATRGDFDHTNDTNSAEGEVTLTWGGMDNPSIKVNGGVDEVQVKEDGSVDVNVVAELGDNAVSTDYLTVTVTGIDSSWGFSSTVGTYNASTGTWTYTVPAGQNLNTDLTFDPPAESDVDLTGLVASVTATDPVEGISAQGNDDGFYITVDAVADNPSITGSDDVGAVNTALDVDFQGHLGTDTDGSESITGYQISGLASGFTVTVNGSAISAVNGVYTIAPSNIANVKVIAPTDYAGTQNIDVTVLTKDTPSDNEYDNSDNTNSDTTEISLTWVDNPTITVENSVGVEVQNAQVYEDGSVSLTVDAGFGSVHTSTSVLTVTVTGINSSWGFSPSVGTYNASAGTWTYTAAANTEITEVLKFTPPAQSDVDLSGLVATVTLNDSVNSITLTDSDDFNIIVDAVADKPDVNAGADQSVLEGTDVTLDISGSLGADKDGSESITGYQISGVPDGFIFGGKGTNLGGGVWSFTVAEISSGLTVSTNAGYKGEVDFVVKILNTDTATDTDFNSSNNTNSDTDTVKITWAEDDQPDAVNDTRTVKETKTITGNVMDNDDKGDNTPTTVTEVDGTVISSSGWTIIDGDYGTLKIKADGTYTYIADSVNSDKTDSFSYTITDVDGDSDDATLKISIDNNIEFYDNHTTLWGYDTKTSYNIFLNDGPNGDGTGLNSGTRIESITYNGTTYSVSSSGSRTIDLGWGKLTFKSNGDYTYTVDNADQDHKAALTINIVDSDGTHDTQSFTATQLDYGWDGTHIIIEGSSISDVINGTDGYSDIIKGGSGNDYINGQKGNDILYGGKGADDFVFDSLKDGMDTIKDFSHSQGDQINLTSLLDGHYDATQDSIDDFVFQSVKNGDTYISVDVSGSGNSSNATVICILDGVSGIDLDTDVETNYVAI